MVKHSTRLLLVLAVAVAGCGDDSAKKDDTTAQPVAGGSKDVQATPEAAAPASPLPVVAAPTEPPTATTPPDPAPEEWKVGDQVRAKWTNGRWYPGKIAAVLPDGTFDVDYDDGDKSKGLPPAKLRRPGARKSTNTSTAKASGGKAEPCSGPGMVERCNGVCVNLQTDDDNCGGCGNQCSSGYHCDGHMFCRDADGNL